MDRILTLARSRGKVAACATEARPSGWHPALPGASAYAHDMLDQAIRIHERTLHWLEALVADMSDDDLSRPMAEGHHSGMWVLGHLSFAIDRARTRVGEAVQSSQDRERAFGPGSTPDEPLPQGITKATLLAELREKHALLIRAIAAADPAVLEAPHRNPFHEGTSIQTMADTVANLLTAHAGYHLGQLSVYRRALGRAPLL